MNKSALLGVHHLFLGFKLILRPEVRIFVIIPLLINILTFTGLFYWIGGYFTIFIHWLEEFLPHWLMWLAVLLWIVFGLACLFVISYLFTMIATLLACPFNGLLSEKLFKLLTGKDTPSAKLTLFETVKTFPKAIKRELQKMGYSVPRALILLLLLWIPIIGMVIPFVWFIFSAWCLAQEYIDYPMDNHHISFPHMQHLLKQEKSLVLGFGIAALILTMVPIVNLFVMPAAVAGATSLWANTYQSMQN